MYFPDLAKLSVSRRFTYAIAVCSLISISIALRLIGPGLDTQNYINIFEGISSQGIDQANRYEPLFQALTWIFTRISTSSAVVFGLLIGTALLIKAFAVRKSGGNLTVFLLAYCSLWMATLENNQIRAAVALAFIYLTLVHIERRPIRAMIYAAAAVGFHYSMILIVAVIATVELLNEFNRSKTRAIVILIISTITVSFAYETVAPEIITNALLVTENLDIAQIRLVSPYTIIIGSIFATFCIARFMGGVSIPYYFHHVGGTMAIGIVIFVWLGINSLPYSYRVLETTSAVSPMLLASIWNRNSGKAIRLCIATTLIMAAVFAPVYWATNSY